jgi:hypothetical protein
MKRFNQRSARWLRRVGCGVVIGLGLMTGGSARAEGLGFDRLAGFEFKPLAYEDGQESAAVVADGLRQIPDDIKALNGQSVVLNGYMLPVKLSEGLVTEFLLIRDPMVCCYGAVPKVNEWVTVRMKGKGLPPLMDVPLAFAGMLKVGPVLDGGYLTAIYELECTGQVPTK